MLVAGPLWDLVFAVIQDQPRTAVFRIVDSNPEQGPSAAAVYITSVVFATVPISALIPCQTSVFTL